MANLAKSIVIVGAKRTAFGTMQGALKAISANDLAVHASKAAWGTASSATACRRAPTPSTAPATSA